MFSRTAWSYLAGAAWFAMVFLTAPGPAPGADEPITSDPRVAVIKEAHITVTLPPHWKTTPERVEKNGRLTIKFRRDPLDDRKGRRIMPSVGFVIEPTDPGEDLVEYSMAKRDEAPFKVLETYDAEDGRYGEVGGIGYLTSYMDRGGAMHKGYVLHTIVGEIGIQITLDGTEADFDLLDSEFKAILKSLRVLK